jgi:hypothetical protein
MGKKGSYSRVGVAIIYISPVLPGTGTRRIPEYFRIIPE